MAVQYKNAQVFNGHEFVKTDLPLKMAILKTLVSIVTLIKASI